MTFNEMLALVSALGGGTALGVLAQGARDWFTGKAGREKQHNQELADQRDRAWTLVEAERRRADAAEAAESEAASAKRRALELASQYRGLLFRNGIDPGEWPPGLN